MTPPVAETETPHPPLATAATTADTSQLLICRPIGYLSAILEEPWRFQLPAP